MMRKRWPTMDDLERYWPKSIDPFTVESGEAVMKQIEPLQKLDCGNPKGFGWIGERSVSALQSFIRSVVGGKLEHEDICSLDQFISDVPGSTGPFAYGTGGGWRVIRSGKEMT